MEGRSAFFVQYCTRTVVGNGLTYFLWVEDLQLGRRAGGGRQSAGTTGSHEVTSDTNQGRQLISEVITSIALADGHCRVSRMVGRAQHVDESWSTP